MAALETESLEKALDQLDRGLDEANADPGSELKRDGVIQRFEYSMDLCWKLLQRYLKLVAQIPDSALRTKKDLFREAARLGLLADAEAWISYYEARNETAHSYKGETAAMVFSRAKAFLPDALRLLEALRHAA